MIELVWADAAIATNADFRANDGSCTDQGSRADFRPWADDGSRLYRHVVFDARLGMNRCAMRNALGSRTATMDAEHRQTICG